MSVKKVRVARGAFYSHFIDEFERRGGPVQTWMEDAGLPLVMREDPDSYVSSSAFWSFLSRAEKNIGEVEATGNAVRSLRLGTFSLPTRTAISTAPTLISGLQQLVQWCPHENSDRSLWLDNRHPEYIRVFSSSAFSKLGYHANYLQNWAAIEVVRHFAGSSWVPAEIAFQSKLPPDERFYEDVVGARLFEGQTSAWISIPKKQVARMLSASTVLNMVQAAAGSVAMADNEAIRELLKAFIRDGKSVSVEQAAEWCGLSLRTLQRLLTKTGSSFRSLLHEARCEIATEHLMDGDTRVIDVAMALGYQDSSHFTRAFRKVTGLTPTEFQRQLQKRAGNPLH